MKILLKKSKSNSESNKQNNDISELIHNENIDDIVAWECACSKNKVDMKSNLNLSSDSESKLNIKNSNQDNNNDNDKKSLYHRISNNIKKNIKTYIIIILLFVLILIILSNNLNLDKIKILFHLIFDRK